MAVLFTHICRMNVRKGGFGFLSVHPVWPVASPASMTRAENGSQISSCTEPAGGLRVMIGKEQP